jgi:hypothetical protein
MEKGGERVVAAPAAVATAAVVGAAEADLADPMTVVEAVAAAAASAVLEVAAAVVAVAMAMAAAREARALTPCSNTASSYSMLSCSP